MRSLLGSGRTAGSTAHRARRAIPRGRYGGLTAAARTASRSGPPTVAGRWSLLPAVDPDPTVRAHALARTLLDRHGVVTRGAVAAEGVEGGFSAVYRILSAFEDSGQARRGYVVEGLGAAQFAMDGAVDRLRAAANARDRGDAPPDPYAGPPGSPANPTTDASAAWDPSWPPPTGPHAVPDFPRTSRNTTPGPHPATPASTPAPVAPRAAAGPLPEPSSSPPPTRRTPMGRPCPGPTPPPAPDTSRAARRAPWSCSSTAS
ncbi:Lhr family helicase [Streptomyces aureus]